MVDLLAVAGASLFSMIAARRKTFSKKERLFDIYVVEIEIFQSTFLNFFPDLDHYCTMPQNEYIEGTFPNGFKSKANKFVQKRSDVMVDVSTTMNESVSSPINT